MTIAVPPSIALEPLLVAPRTASSRGGRLPDGLREAYGSDLAIPFGLDRPTIIANFVSTIDGVVSFQTPGGAGGGEVSGFFGPDRFVMGLLRAMSDAVLIGAGTLRDADKHVWSPSHVHPASAAAYAQLRENLGLASQPTTVVVTGSGDIDLDRPGLADPSVPITIVTTDRGLAALHGQQPLAAHVEAISAGSDRVGAQALIEILRQRGFQLVLTEGGPHLFAQLLDAHLVDELFLTIAPQFAGRSPEMPRLGLVEDASFTVAGAPWSTLVDVRNSGDHLFVRYRLKEIAQ